MGTEKSTLPQTITLVAALILLVIAVGLSITAALSPSWQVVDIREYHEEHHHGLWQDCTRAHIHRRVDEYHHDENGEVVGPELAPLSCTYKFDKKADDVVRENMSDNSAAIEAELHQLYGWQKAVMIGIVLSLLAAIIGIFLGTCAPCHSACSLIFTIFIFIALFFSASALGVFYFASHRVDSRFVHGHVGTYEQNTGWAFTIYGLGTLVFLFALIVSLVATYQLLRKSEDRVSMPVRELAPLYNSHMSTSAM